MKITEKQETILVFLICLMVVSIVYYALVQAEKVKYDRTICEFLFNEHEKVTVRIPPTYLNATVWWCDYYCPKSLSEGIEEAKNNVLNNIKEA